MTVASEVFELLRTGAEPVEIMGGLGISRYQYDSALDKLVSMGALGNLHKLPGNAETELCPPNIVTRLLIDVFESADWAERITSTVRALCTRYGITEPPITDTRYTRGNWTGQAFRRVDFTALNGIDYMVVGALMPRADKKRWKEGVPYHRTVYIEGVGNPVTFSWPRGRFLSNYVVRDRVFASLSLLNDDVVDELTLAAAWVCEARALFPERMIEE